MRRLFVTLALAGAFFAAPALACSGPACCVVDGVPAACRSPVIERQATATVQRRCPRCDPRAISDSIFSYQMNRGPYESADELARDALLALPAVAVAGQRCNASHYGVGDDYGGRRTAFGERMNPKGMTAAHRTLPFGTRVRVTHGDKSVVVRINDRGPSVRGRCIDLSHGAAMAIRLPGVGPVTVERL